MKSMEQRMSALVEGVQSPWFLFKVRIFKARYKTLGGLGLSKEERLWQSIEDTKDDVISLRKNADDFHLWYRQIFLPRWWAWKPRKRRANRSANAKGKGTTV